MNKYPFTMASNTMKHYKSDQERPGKMEKHLITTDWQNSYFENDHLLTTIFIFKAVTTKIPTAFLQKYKNHSKICTKTEKVLGSQRYAEKKTNGKITEGLTTIDFKIYYSKRRAAYTGIK